MADRKHQKGRFDGRTKKKSMMNYAFFFFNEKNYHKIPETHYGVINSIDLIYLSKTILVINV